jgi:hypothetical protein
VTDTLSFEAAMTKAVTEAISRNATGFFYQQHSNGYQIAGFYSDDSFLSDTTKWQGGDGHRRFALASLTDIRESTNATTVTSNTCSASRRLSEVPRYLQSYSYS